MTLRVDGPEGGRLSRAIESAFQSYIDLDETLNNRLGDNIFKYSGIGAQYPEMRRNLIRQYNDRNHIDQLVSGLSLDRPDNAQLADFAWRHGIPVSFRPQDHEGELSSSTRGGLERMLDPERGFQDVGQYFARAGEIMKAICQITVPVAEGVEYGTGFLIGKQHVLTNWHVVEHVSDQNREDVRLKFDFRTGGDGITVSRGTPYTLAQGAWLTHHSPYHSDDERAEPLAQRLASERPGDSLDFAILKLADAAGSRIVAGAPRGCLRLSQVSSGTADFDTKSAALFIFQHPYDEATRRVLPLQFDWEKPAIRGVNRNATRVIYDVNTRPGSSGSPCFNGKLELTALHHAGGKDWPARAQYLYNQGIPITRIRDAIPAAILAEIEQP